MGNNNVSKDSYKYVIEFLASKPKLSFHTVLALLGGICIVFLWFYTMYSAFWGQAETFTHASTFYLTSLILVFIFFPFKRKKWFDAFSWWFAVDFILISVAFGILLYIRWDIDGFMFRGGGMPNEFDHSISILLAVITLEATRRTVGLALSIIAILFFLYAGFSDAFFIPSILKVASMPFDRILDILLWDTSGIFGIPVSVVSTFIVILLIFGSMMFACGVGGLLTKIALSLTGGMVAGPAKAAVLGSSFFGMLTGSASSNVLVVGTFTIPLMKKIGFKSEIAGAIECCSSVGSLVMPPVMGAAAFIMAAFMGVSYWKVAFYAIIPALLYYFYVFLSVHFEAKKIGIGKQPSSIKLLPVLLNRGHLLLPILVLFFAIFSGASPVLGAFWATICAFAVSCIKSETRMSVGTFLLSMEKAIRGGLVIFTACGAAGFIIAAVNITGVGLRFSEILLLITGGSLFLGCVVAILGGLILGLGLTPAVVYITMYALMVPALIKLGAPVVSAHMLSFYYGLLGELTPPVAISAFTAAAIAGGNPMTTSWHAMRIGLGLYLLPVIFVYHPELLLIGNAIGIILNILLVSFSIICLAAGFMGYLFTNLGLFYRMFFLSAFLLMTADVLFAEIAGIVLGGAAFFINMIKHKNIMKGFQGNEKR